MKIQIQVPFDPATVTGLGPDYEKAARDAMAAAARRIRVETKPLMPKDTGDLQRRFYVGYRAGVMELVWTVPYAPYVDLGAGPHTIRPRDPSGFLKFPGTNAFAGMTIYTKKVNHPGQIGQFYRFPVGALSLKIMNEELQKAFARVRLRPT